MGLSGFLYVAIVVGWAVYLVPFALKRYDEATRNRSIDRFSSAMRILGRHEVEDAEAAAITRPPRPRASQQAQRAARQAARRRRRVLLLLLLTTGAVAGLAAAGLTTWWAVAVPGVLVLLWLMVCRGQARREDGARRPFAGWETLDVPAPRREEPAAEPLPADAGEVVEQAAVPDHVDVDDEIDVAAPPADDEPTVVLSREGVDEEESPVGSGSLWDPVPVTLPTYVHKPRAPRTIRTIELGSTDVQTSSSKAEESAIYTHHVDPASLREQPDGDRDAQEQAEEHKPTRRAVGE